MFGQKISASCCCTLPAAYILAREISAVSMALTKTDSPRRDLRDEIQAHRRARLTELRQEKAELEKQEQDEQKAYYS